MTGAAVEVRGLRKSYGEAAILRGLNLTIEPGAYTVVLGPSGSGKTTLLAVLGGFTEADSGQVLIDGVDVTAWTPARRPTTTVFQDYALFPHMSVADNVGFGLAMRRVRGRQRADRVAQALALVGLADFGRRSIASLSGGQRQRVALARALVVEPAVLLLDEPLGALDLALRRAMQEELAQIQRTLGTTFVHVTHDQEEAMALADTIVVMREGAIDDAGSPERLYLRPRTAFTARFMGDSNLLRGPVLTTGPEAAVGTPIGELPVGLAEITAAGSAPGGTATVAIRPEHLRVEYQRPDEEGLLTLGEFTVTESHFLGVYHRSLLTRGSVTLVAYLPPAAAPRPGLSRVVGVAPEHIVVVKEDPAGPVPAGPVPAGPGPAGQEDPR